MLGVELWQVDAGAGGHVIAARLRAQLNRPEAALRIWRALLTEGLPNLPATMSFESVAMSCLVTSMANFLPRRGE